MLYSIRATKSHVLNHYPKKICFIQNFPITSDLFCTIKSCSGFCPPLVCVWKPSVCVCMSVSVWLRVSPCSPLGPSSLSLCRTHTQWAISLSHSLSACVYVCVCVFGREQGGLWSGWLSIRASVGMLKRNSTVPFFSIWGINGKAYMHIHTLTLSRNILLFSFLPTVHLAILAIYIHVIHYINSSMLLILFLSENKSVNLKEKHTLLQIKSVKSLCVGRGVFTSH